MHHVKQRQQGDTLVEVMLAVAVLSLATVLTMTIVNHAHRSLLSAINRESVQTEVNSQAEWLQYFHDMALKTNDTNSPEYRIWQAILNEHLAEGSGLLSETCTAGDQAFYIARMGEDNSQSYNLQRFDQITQPRRDDDLPAAPGNGLWVDAVRSPSGSSVRYVDLMVKSCWTAIDSRREERASVLVRINLNE